AVHDRAHGQPGLLDLERPTLDDRGQGGPNLLAHRSDPGAPVSARPAVANEPVRSSSSEASPSPARRRKLARRCGPWGVRTLSGWNWTPSRGKLTWRMPMITRSTSDTAVTRSSGRSVSGSIASE